MKKFLAVAFLCLMLDAASAEEQMIFMGSSNTITVTQTIMEPPEDLVIVSNREIRLIRQIKACSTVREALSASKDVTAARCFK